MVIVFWIYKGEIIVGLLNNIKVKTKLLLSFIIVAILIAVVGVIGVISLGTVNKNSEQMYNDSLQSVYYAGDIKQALLSNESDLVQLIYIKDNLIKSDLESNIETNTYRNNTYITAFEKTSMSTTEKQIWTTFKSQVASYTTLRETITQLIDSQNYNEAIKQYQSLSVIRNAMTTNLEKVITINTDSAKGANSNNEVIFSTSNVIMIILVIAGLIIAIGLGLILSKNINTPLLKIEDLAENLANFDLTHEYPVTRKDEFGKTGAALAKAQKNIKELIKTIMANSQDMSASSEELSGAAEQISSKTEEMDRAIKEITSGIQETSAASEQISICRRSRFKY